MQINHVSQVPTEGSEPSFLVGLSTDDGRSCTMLASGRQLDRPLEFAAFATTESGAACTSPVGSSGGAWHALLGQIMGRGTPQPARSNQEPVAEFSQAWLDEDRRQSLLRSTHLGQVAQAACEGAKTEAKEAAPTRRKTEHELFIERSQAADEVARRERIATVSSHLERTHVGRDVLQNDSK